ncbi:MAG: DUF5678 domain-containing protein [bacterium]|nr:DUF5678 domain-containing protein [bacterium]
MIKDFTKIANRYKGKWIALTEDEKKVVSSGKSAKEVLEKAKKEGVKNPILFKMPSLILPYVGINL